jgi:hypothetical protein
MPTVFRGLLPVLGAVWLCAAPPAPGASSYRGQVVDGQSGRPVEGGPPAAFRQGRLHHHGRE